MYVRHGESQTAQGPSAPNTSSSCNHYTQKQGTCLRVQSSGESHVRVRVFRIHDPRRKERHKELRRSVETARRYADRRAVWKGRGTHAVKTVPRLHALPGKVHARTRTAQGDLFLTAGKASLKIGPPGLHVLHTLFSFVYYFLRLCSRSLQFRPRPRLWCCCRTCLGPQRSSADRATAATLLCVIPRRVSRFFTRYRRRVPRHRAEFLFRIFLEFLQARRILCSILGYASFTVTHNIVGNLITSAVFARVCHLYIAKII